MFASIASGESSLSHLSTGKDVDSTRSVLQQLGVKFREDTGQKLIVLSPGLNELQAPEGTLETGNSGTTMRLMAGMLSGRPFRSTLTGDASLRSRPMRRITEPLTQMGAQISTAPDGTAPLTMEPAELHGIDYTLPVASAQVKSAIILAGLQVTSGETIVRENRLSRRHTEMMLRYLGAPVAVQENTVTVNPLSSSLAPFDLRVPGDPSSAAFWATAAAIIPDSVCRIEDIHLSPERTAFFHALQSMGTSVEMNVRSEEMEPRGDLVVRYRPLQGIELDENSVPALIDELPLIAVAGMYATGKTRVTGAEELRYKECDRLDAVVKNVNTMGGSIKEMNDGFLIHGRSGPGPQGAGLDSFGDHRIAMAFAIAALGASGPSEMSHPEVAAISYPEFWEVLNELTSSP